MPATEQSVFTPSSAYSQLLLDYADASEHPESGGLRDAHVRRYDTHYLALETHLTRLRELIDAALAGHVSPAHVAMHITRASLQAANVAGPLAEIEASLFEAEAALHTMIHL